MPISEIDSIFAPALASIREINRKASLVLADVAELRKEEEIAYRIALETFDWSFGFTDDDRVYRAGFQSLQRLRAMQQDVDPTGAIWMAHSAVEQFGAPRPIVRGAA